MSNKVKKAANKLYKQLKGNITFEAVEAFLKKLGYKIIFFNTAPGDAELARYCLTEKAQRTDAFTYCGSAKIVFINSLISVEDRFYLLLHEVAHIVLKHLEPGSISMHNGLLLDIDANAFVHYLLNPPRKVRFATIVCLILVIIAIGGAFHYTEKENRHSASITAASVEHNNTQVENIVYITSTGERFHQINCSSLVGKDTAQISRTEALKIHTPCKLCNP